jgi:phospholipase C
MAMGRVRMRNAAVLAAAGVLVAGVAACSLQFGPDPGQPGSSRSERVDAAATTAGIHKIKHVIVVMQENRSFDSYFGTYPGADGIPVNKQGEPAVCMPDPGGGCIRPHHDAADINADVPHSQITARADVDGGKMDGFITAACMPPRQRCPIEWRRQVMGYHTAAEIPNYWTYARQFALDDRMFEPVRSWSLPDHEYMVSAWSAKCRGSSPMSCHNSINPDSNVRFNRAVQQELATGTTKTDLAWTDITWLLHSRHVGWAYYIQKGTQPDCADDSEATCPPVRQSANTPGIWNPLPLFGDVHEDGQLDHIRDLSRYFAAARAGTLPSVSWITPSGPDSEHAPASVHKGQAYVTAVINAAMKSPDWDSTAIFLSWDDWGGLYDHVIPPRADRNGYGLRVPAMTISAYARAGYIDHQTLSSDGYLKFIEDDFLGGARLDPRTDGRPDRRPDVRENARILGSLTADFNFSQPPRPPLLLPTNPSTDSPGIPGYFTGKPPCRGCTDPPPAMNTRTGAGKG